MFVWHSLNHCQVVRTKMVSPLLKLNLFCFVLVTLFVGLNGKRDKKLFSLFNVVTFKNDGCTTQSDGNTQGTCLSSSECTARGGSADGNCAAGFGVCCAFILTGCSVGPVNQNCTYIRNSGFPSADTTSPLNCKYTFKRISDGLCQIRLDFKTLNLALDSTDIGLCGNAGDSLQVRSPFSSFGAAFPPTVCGNLNGQHMYFETGTTGDAGTLEINTGSGVGDRRYDIKVTYIECCTINRPPSGCTQYFTGPTGTISSYNHAGGQMLQAQMYTNCIRQEKGYCQTTFKESAITNPDPFDLGSPGITPTTFSTASDCSDRSHVLIPSTVEYISAMTEEGNDVDYLISHRCGTVFGGLTNQSFFTEPASLTSIKGFPFEVRVSSRVTSQDKLMGFSLDFNQVPC